MKKGVVILPLLILLTTVFCNATDLETTWKPLAALGNTYYAIQSDGGLMAWGDSFHGAICSDVDLPSFSQANLVLKKAVFATGNMNLGLAIDQEQILWGWGWDWTGRLLETADTEKTPIRLLDHVVNAAAGLHHCLALQEDGTVWSWGSNQYGQLGYGEQETEDNQPPIHSPAQVMDHVRAIATDGMFASFAVKEDGSVWAWGKQDGCNDAIWYTPRPILDHVQEARWTQSNDRGDILLLGNDGNLWRSDFDRVQKCYTSPEKFLEHVAIFSSHCAVTVNHALWTWGLAPQTTPDSANTCIPVRVMENVLYAEADNSCTLAIRTDGSLWEIRDDVATEPVKGEAPSYPEPIHIGDHMMTTEHQPSSPADNEPPTTIASESEDGAGSSPRSGDEKQSSRNTGNGSVPTNERTEWGLAFGTILLLSILGILRKKH